MPRGRKPGAAWRTGDREMAILPAGESAFEKLVRKLKLTPEDYEASTQLRDFVTRHYKGHYVPESLLKVWGLVLND